MGKGTNEGTAISSSNLIRLGGLAAVVGGALYFSGLILYLPANYPIDLHGIGNIFGGLWLVLFIALLVLQCHLYETTH